jgi:hypothetical protein
MTTGLFLSRDVHVAQEEGSTMVFDKIKNAVTGAKSGRDLGDVASEAGLGSYAKYLNGITFPASKDEVLGALQANGAPDSLSTHVESMSQNKFDSAKDVFKTILNR